MQIFDCTKTILYVVIFPQGCTEFHKFSTFREIPEYSRFVATTQKNIIHGHTQTNNPQDKLNHCHGRLEMRLLQVQDVSLAEDRKNLQNLFQPPHRSNTTAASALQYNCTSPPHLQHTVLSELVVTE